MILSFRIDTSVQTVQTQIRLLPEEQSDKGLHCLHFPLHFLEALLLRKSHLVQLLGWLQQRFWVSEYLGKFTVFQF